MTLYGALRITVTAFGILGASLPAGCGGHDHQHESSLALAAPGDLDGMVMNGGVHLSWQDNSLDEDGFMIMRRTAGSPFVEVGRAGPDATYFHDRTVVAGNTYRYIVHAVQGQVSSAPSNEIDVAVP